MFLNDVESMAAALYDGGWRATDRTELIAEYELTDKEAEAICEKLEVFEFTKKYAKGIAKALKNNKFRRD